jgi:hypothetical protein
MNLLGYSLRNDSIPHYKFKTAQDGKGSLHIVFEQKAEKKYWYLHLFDCTLPAAEIKCLDWCEFEPLAGVDIKLIKRTKYRFLYMIDEYYWSSFSSLSKEIYTEIIPISETPAPEQEPGAAIASEYIYLIQDRGCVDAKLQIYKLGKTSCVDPYKRLGGYKKGYSIKIIRQVPNCDLAEKQLLAAFRKKYKQELSHGKEYFSGSYVDMIRDIGTY